MEALGGYALAIYAALKLIEIPVRIFRCGTVAHVFN